MTEAPAALEKPFDDRSGNHMIVLFANMNRIRINRLWPAIENPLKIEKIGLAGGRS